MRWVQEINNIKNSVEETLLDEFVNIQESECMKKTL